ncbi:hypothetical protein KGM_214675 [Danaus plexippus plexippus]|uniref:Uncharacterized protein n=1 Tax=Danaus plexippus plexippus TaxID=278856 RepID=A0A212FLV2_DANPL|nr:hypothetical protein KGM_214675 [Danaus plexippus plexippus]
MMREIFHVYQLWMYIFNDTYKKVSASKDSGPAEIGRWNRELGTRRIDLLPVAPRPRPPPLIPSFPSTPPDITGALAKATLTP